MLVTKDNISSVKIGGWAYHCCEEDLKQVDEELLKDMKGDAEDPMLNYIYYDKKIEALMECFAIHCRSHQGTGSSVDCSKEIHNLYIEICNELKIQNNFINS